MWIDLQAIWRFDDDQPSEFFSISFPGFQSNPLNWILCLPYHLFQSVHFILQHTQSEKAPKNVILLKCHRIIIIYFIIFFGRLLPPIARIHNSHSVLSFHSIVSKYFMHCNKSHSSFATGIFQQLTEITKKDFSRIFMRNWNEIYPLFLAFRFSLFCLCLCVRVGHRIDGKWGRLFYL